MLSLFARSQKVGGYLFSVRPTIGYDLNMLKAPSSITDGNQQLGRSDLWQNAPFTGVYSRFMTKSKGGKHKLDFNGLFERGLFTGEDVQAGEFAANGRYSLNLKKFSYKTHLGFRNYQRTGVDEDNLIGAPLSYNRYSLNQDLDFKIGKRSHLIVSPFSVYKNYSWGNFDQFMYLDNGVSVAFQKGYKLKRTIGWSVDATFHQRNYTIVKAGQEPESVNRIWRYYGGGYGMRFPINENFKIVSRVGYTHRSDIIQERLGYNQYSAQLGIELKKGKFKGKLNASTDIRHYTDFEVPNGLLRYNYIRYTLDARYAFTNRFSIYARNYSKFRLSNADDESRRTLRSYFITKVRVGATWTFRGKYTRKPD